MKPARDASADSSRTNSMPPLLSPASTLPFPLVERSGCGAARLELRDKFNVSEIKGLELVKKCAEDTEGSLNPAKLRMLLSDFPGVAVRKEDEEFILQIAANDDNRRIDESEILFGLRASYAFNNMPKSVCAAVERYKIDKEQGWPTDTQMQECLRTLNDSRPVDSWEVNEVLNLAKRLATTNQSDPMRKAIATWYINIERAPPGQIYFLQQTLSNAPTELEAVASDVKKMLFSPAEKNLAVPVLASFALIAFVCNVVFLGVAIQQPSLETCPHDLNTVMLASAVVNLLLLVCFLIVYCGGPSFSSAILAAGGCLLLLCITLDVVGFHFVLRSTGEQCGEKLHSTCYFGFVALPGIEIIIACCFPCCFFAPIVKSKIALDPAAYIELGSFDEQRTGAPNEEDHIKTPGDQLRELEVQLQKTEKRLKCTEESLGEKKMLLQEKEEHLKNAQDSLKRSKNAEEEKSKLIKQLQSQLDAYDRERAR